MKIIWLRALMIAGLLFAAGTAAHAAQTLNLFIWSEYIDPQLVAEFEHENDCHVNIDLFEDAESMLAKLQGGGSSLYDVVVPPDHLVPVMAKLKLLAPLRRENIPNVTNLMAKFVNPPFDPGNRYTVPYQWGTMGVFIRQSKDKPVPHTWGIFFDPKLEEGSFFLIDSMRDTIGAALKYQGHSMNSTDPKELIAARELLIAAKARCTGFEGSVGGKNKVVAKVARSAIVYSGEGVRGMGDDAETVYFIPDEGSEIWVDNLAVPAGAPHRDLAEKFINFILDAKNGAQLSDFTQFATPNQAALAHIRPADLKNPAIYPPPAVAAKLEFLKDLGGKSRLYDEIWTKVKAN